MRTILMLFLVLFAVSAEAQFLPFGFIKKRKAPSNYMMAPGSSVTAGNSLSIDNYELDVQDDGNVVLYRIYPSGVAWYSNTWSGAGSCWSCVFEFRVDGNLVVRDGGSVRWSSGTSAVGGKLEFRNVYPYFLIFDAAGFIVWASW